VKRYQFCKALQKDREDIARRLVDELTVSIELFVGKSNEDLRLQECVSVREYK